MEVGRLVGADDEESLLAASDRLGRERMGVEPDLQVGESRLRHLQPRLGIGDDPAVPRVLLHPDLELVDRQLVACRLRERDVSQVRRVERAAEDPLHPSSTSSPSISTSSPVFAPAALSASASSLSPGGRPATR